MQQHLFWVERKLAYLYFPSVFLRGLMNDLKEYLSPAAIRAPTICILKPIMQHIRLVSLIPTSCSSSLRSNTKHPVN